MKTLPFLLAPPESCSFEMPVLYLGDRPFTPGEPVTGWDYLSPVTIVVDVSYDLAEICKATSVENPQDIGAFVQIDCLATMTREVTTVPLSSSSTQERLEVRLESGTIAAELEVRTGLLLLRDNPARSSELAAFRRGSRLTEPLSPFTFLLEGTGSTFPIEAFDFEPAGLPPQAPWHLHFIASTLADPFKRSVRLNVNTSHPQADVILSEESELVNSVVHHGVALDLMLACVPLASDDIEGEPPEGSVAEVVDGMCRGFLGTSLAEFAHEFQNDPVELMTRLRGKAGLLNVGPQ